MMADAYSDFEPLSADDMEAAMTMSVSDAMFASVPNSYPTGAHIQCRCQVTDSRNLSDGCWIGLFQVGWDSPETDCICKATCRQDPDANQLIGAFTPSQLPNDTKDFYQFCFVTADGLVKGASTPFVFRPGSASDFDAEVDEEIQGIVVTARNVELQNELSNLRNALQLQRSSSEQRENDLSHELELANDKVLGLRKRLQDFSCKLQQQDQLLTEKDHEIAYLQQAKAAQQIGDSQERQQKEEQINQLQRQVQSLADQLGASMHAATTHEEEMTDLRAQLQHAQGEANQKQEMIDVLQVQLNESRRTAEDEKKNAEAAVSQLTATQQQVNELQAVNSELQLRLEAGRAEEGELMKQLQSRHDSLRIAYEGVKSRFHKAKEQEQLARQNYNDVIELNKQLLQREQKQRDRVDDMQRRLKEGATEYKRLIRRFREAASGQYVPNAEEQADEFHDARSDEQSLVDLSDDQPQQQQQQQQQQIYRPPTMQPMVQFGNFEQPQLEQPQQQEEQQQQQQQQLVCPVCNEANFENQEQLQQHANAHFD